MVSCDRKKQSFIRNDLSSSISNLGKHKNLAIEERKSILKKAEAKVWKLDNDSLKSKFLYEISFQYFLLNDSLRFRTTNTQARKLSYSQANSNIVAMSYWDLAEFYHNYYIEDSAYYYYHKAQEIYLALDDTYQSAKLWLNMAIVQKNSKDYTGSEASTIKAISLFKPLNKYKYLHSAYNNLGIIYDELEAHKKALKYYFTAGKYLAKTERNELFPSLWNNIGVAYNNWKHYAKAAKYYDKALKGYEKLETRDLELYAMLIDNRAYNQFQSGYTTKVLSQYKKALLIRKENEVVPGIIISRIHLANYFLSIKDTIRAKHNASKAKTLARASLNAKGLLTSLLMLSKMTRDSTLFYTREYIRINDSLQQRERNTRNKFARIRYETAGYIAKTERLSDRLTKTYFVGIVGAVIVILLVIIQLQRTKNKKLILIHEKNKRFEEGREKEKQRISKELHDGVLAKLFGVSLSLEVLNNSDSTKAKKKRAHGIANIKAISEEIRLLSHELRENALITTDFNTTLSEFKIKATTEQTKVQVEIDASIDWGAFDNQIKINLFRILQEGVLNSYKHASAKIVLIEFYQNDQQLILTIHDDGKGFNHLESTAGIGIKNIQERTRSLGGHLEIASIGVIESGTLLKITIPLTQNLI